MTARHSPLRVLILIAGLPLSSCTPTSRLQPATFQSALLTCDCRQEVAGELQDVVFDRTPLREHVGQEIWRATPAAGCELHVIRLADVGIPQPSCFPPQNLILAEDGHFRDEAVGACAEKRTQSKCVGVNSTRDQVLTASGPLSAAAKCAQLCGSVSVTGSVRVCIDQDPPTVGQVCEFNPIGFPTTYRCPAPRAAVLGFDSCTPVSDRDPHAFVVELLPSSRVRIAQSSPGGAQVSMVPRGFLAFTTRNCSQDSCVVVLSRLHIALPDFSIAGESLSHVALGLDGDALGTLRNLTQMTIPATGVSAQVRGRLGGEDFDREGPISSTTALVGRVSFDSGAATFELSAASSELGVTLIAELDGRFRNLPPRPVFHVPATIECSSPGGSSVAVDASETTDPDEPIDDLSFEWFVDGLPTGSNLSQDSVWVPLGTHVIELVVMDSEGFVSRTTKTVEVVDTVPPELAEFYFGGPTCLWPPRHELAVLDIGRDIRTLVHDACDPAPVVRFSSVSSSEAANGAGDGNTEPDYVLRPDRVCLRGERSGTGDSRTYSIGVVAADRSGNEVDPTITVVVPHDLGSTACRADSNTEWVSDESERCAAELVAADPTPENLVPSGCGIGVGNVSLLTVLLALVRRRRQ